MKTSSRNFTNSHTHKSKRLTMMGGLLACLTLSNASLAETDYTELSLEDLMSIQVTSVTKKARPISETAAAVYVITDEDIERSKANELPELLRLAPGVEVFQINSHDWAVSIRGFNDRFANKLLVMIDGRSLYTPIFSGVMWDAFDIPLGEIERIEIIRGPGASIWGDNAVNGVINIITKAATGEPSIEVETAFSNIGDSYATFRGNRQVSDKVAMRGYVQYKHREDQIFADTGENSVDDLYMWSLGGRIDATLNEKDDLSVRISGYDADIEALSSIPSMSFPFMSMFRDERYSRGAAVQANWTRKPNEQDVFSTNFSFDHMQRSEAGIEFQQDLVQLSSDFSRTLSSGSQLVAGAEVQHNSTSMTGLNSLAFMADDERETRGNAFIHYEHQFPRQNLQLIVGAKVTKSEITDFEVQPTVKLLYRPSDSQTIWSSISRAVRTPSRLDRNMEFIVGFIPPFSPMNPGPLMAAPIYQGNSDVDPEELLAFEVGYRQAFSEGFSLDMNVYYNDFENLILSSTQAPYVGVIGFTPILFIPQAPVNAAEATIMGVEANIKARPVPRLDLELSLSAKDFEIEPVIAGVDAQAQTMVDLSPRVQASLSAHFDLTDRASLSVVGRYYSSLDEIGGYDDQQREFNLDVVYSLEFETGAKLSISGKNLLNDKNIQFQNPLSASPATLIQRSIFFGYSAKF